MQKLNELFLILSTFPFGYILRRRSRRSLQLAYKSNMSVLRERFQQTQNKIRHFHRKLPNIKLFKRKNILFQDSLFPIFSRSCLKPHSSLETKSPASNLYPPTSFSARAPCLQPLTSNGAQHPASNLQQDKVFFLASNL